MSKGSATKGCASEGIQQRAAPAKAKDEVAVTPDSRVVPHPSTKRAQWGLTALFGREAVYYP